MPMSGPIQSFEIPVKCDTLAELGSIPVPVDGAGVFITATQSVWFSSATLPGGKVASADGSSGVLGPTTFGGFWIEGPVAGSAGLLTFNTITVGAAGSGRLIDLPAATFLALPTGTLAYTGNSSATVPSVHAFWVRKRTPTGVSSDGISILKPLGGASREIWERLPGPVTYWQQRLGGVAVIDSVNGSDENFGNAASPLQNEAEAVRRLGDSQVQTFIFKPGATSEATGNIFNDWSQLVAAAALSAGAKTVLFDDSLGAVNIPVGAWDFGPGCTFRGVLPALNSLSPNRVSIVCVDGVTFTTPLYEAIDVNLQYSGTHALMTIPGDAKNRVFYGSRNARFSPSGAGGAIFALSATSIWTAVLLDLATITVAGGGFFMTVPAGATSAGLRVVESGSTAVRLPANALSGAAGPAYSFIIDILGVANLNQAAMPGGVITPTFVDGAPNLPYTPAAGANWVDPDPTTVQAALDRLAALVVTLNGGAPIP